jgi:hypothetical protein
MLNKLDITKNWLPRYTGMPLDRFGDYVLLTNFHNYVHLFAERFGCNVYGEDRTMPAATNSDGLTIINFGMGSSNAATIMDLLSSISGVKAPVTITSRRRSRRCLHSSCTSSCRTRSWSMKSTTAPVSFTPPTAGFGNMMPPSTKSCMT